MKWEIKLREQINQNISVTAPRMPCLDGTVSSTSWQKHKSWWNCSCFFCFSFSCQNRKTSKTSALSNAQNTSAPAYFLNPDWHAFDHISEICPGTTWFLRLWCCFGCFQIHSFQTGFSNGLTIYVWPLGRSDRTDMSEDRSSSRFYDYLIPLVSLSVLHFCMSGHFWRVIDD